MRQQGDLWDVDKNERLLAVVFDVGQASYQDRPPVGGGQTIPGMIDPGSLLVEPVSEDDRAKLSAAVGVARLELRVGNRAAPCFFRRPGELRLGGSWFNRQG